MTLRVAVALAVMAACVSCTPSPERARVAELEQRVAALETRLAELPADEGTLGAAKDAELIIRLGSDDVITRWRAGHELARRGKEAHPLLLDAVRTGEKRQQEAAAAVLSRSADTDLVPDLIEVHALSQDADVRAWLNAALGHARAPQAVDVLIADLSHEERRVRVAAVLALEQVGDARAMPDLARLALQGDALTSQAARDAVLSFGENGILFLQSRWGTLGPRQRDDMIRMIATIPGMKVDEFLEKQLLDAAPLVALQAANVLAQRGNAAGRSLALERLKSDDPVIARRARDVMDALSLIPLKP